MSSGTFSTAHGRPFSHCDCGGYHNSATVINIQGRKKRFIPGQKKRSLHMRWPVIPGDSLGICERGRVSVRATGTDWLNQETYCGRALLTVAGCLCGHMASQRGTFLPHHRERCNDAELISLWSFTVSSAATLISNSQSARRAEVLSLVLSFWRESFMNTDGTL